MKDLEVKMETHASFSTPNSNRNNKITQKKSGEMLNLDLVASDVIHDSKYKK